MDRFKTIQEVVDEHGEEVPAAAVTRLMAECQPADEEPPAAVFKSPHSMVGIRFNHLDGTTSEHEWFTLTPSFLVEAIENRDFAAIASMRRELDMCIVLDDGNCSAWGLSPGELDYWATAEARGRTRSTASTTARETLRRG